MLSFEISWLSFLNFFLMFSLWANLEWDYSRCLFFISPNNRQKGNQNILLVSKESSKKQNADAKCIIKEWDDSNIEGRGYTSNLDDLHLANTELKVRCWPPSMKNVWKYLYCQLRMTFLGVTGGRTSWPATRIWFYWAITSEE